MKRKKCSQCSQEKTLSEFNKCKRIKSGRRSVCRVCQKENGLKYYYQNHEARKAYDRLYNEKNKGKKKKYRDTYKKRFPDKVKKSMVKSVKKYLKRNPDIYEAYSKVSHAKKLGTLKKEPCRDCGTTTDVMAHHDDYGKPLDVIWLCRMCHIAEHKKLRYGT